MEILEFGSKNNKKIVFIPGLLCAWQIWKEYIEFYKNDYHIIIPILPGHNPNEKEEFISIEKTTIDFENIYIKNYGNNIYAIYGMSMGGVLATKLLENKKIIIDKVILEGTPLASYNKIIEVIIKKSYLLATHQIKKRNKIIINIAKNVVYPKDSTQYFLRMIDNVKDKTIINYIKELGKYKLKRDLDLSDTEIYYCYGSKISETVSKKSARYIKKYYPQIYIKCFKGKGHCENFCSDTKQRIEMLEKLISLNNMI